MIMNNNSEPFNTLINSSMIMNNSNELFNARINSSLNDSTTKQAYSFGREVRFKNSSKKDNLYHFYDLPQIRSNRSTTLGYGKRLNSSAIIGCGSNKLYVLPNYFDPKNHNSPGYTFGVRAIDIITYPLIYMEPAQCEPEAVEGGLQIKLKKDKKEVQVLFIM